MCVLVSERFDSTEPCAESALRRSVHQHMRQQSWYLSTYVVDGDEDELHHEANETHDDETYTITRRNDNIFKNIFDITLK